MKKTALTLAVLTAFALPMMPSVANDAQPSSLASIFGQKKQKFLPVHQAFDVQASQEGDKLVVRFVITPEHYVYEDKLSLSLPEGVSASAWQFDQTPSMVDDPQFGQVAVFETDVVATAVLTSKTDLKDENIRIKWQGCAKAGLCYPPETVNVAVNLVGKGGTDNDDNKSGEKLASTDNADKVDNIGKTDKADKTDKATADKTATDKATEDSLGKSAQATSPLVKVVESEKVNSSALTVSEPNSPNTNATSATPNQEAGEVDVFGSNDKTPNAQHLSESTNGEQSSSDLTAPTQNANTSPNALTHEVKGVSADPFGIQKNPVGALVLLFLAGLVLSLTPCVYPMIPIVANIVSRGQGQTNAKRGFGLSASYGVGVATAYGVLGAVVAWFGQALGVTAWLQNPYVLGVFAFIFVVLGVAMFDVIRLRLPSVITRPLQRFSQKGDDKFGSLGGSFVAGGLSALVVSPCVSLPMAGALTAVSASGSVGFGFLALFLFGLGLSLPLMLVGTVQGSVMPKAGVWMNLVKELCGLLLIAVAVSLLGRVLFSPVMLIIWAVWFAFVAVWLFRTKQLLLQALALSAGIWASVLMVGAGMGNTDAYRPLANLQMSTHTATAQHQDLHITTLTELDEILARHDKVLVDLTADWCIECRIMERTLFTNRPAVLADYQVVKLDITETTTESRAVLARYQLFGPPALLIYKKGTLQEILLGEVGRTDFENALTKY